MDAQDSNPLMACRRSARGGKRWVILLGLFYVSFLENAVVQSFSVILNDLTAEFGVSTTFIGVVLGLAFGAPFWLAFVNIPLLRRFSVRQLVMFGGTISSIGIVLNAFARSSTQFSVTILMYGAGHIFAMLPTNSCPADYFPDWFGAATGTMFSGGSIGVMLMPLIFEALIEQYGWRGALLLLGALNGHVIVAGTLLEPPQNLIRVDAAGKSKVSPKDYDHISTSCLKEDKNSQGNVTSNFFNEDGDTCPENAEDDNVIVERSKDSNVPTRCHKGYEQIAEEDKGNEIVEPGTGKDVLEMTERGSVGDEIRDSHLPNDENLIGTSFLEAPHDTDSRRFENRSKQARDSDDEKSGTKKCSPFKTLKTVGDFFHLSIFMDHPLLILICIQTVFYGISFSGWQLYIIPNALAKGQPIERAVIISLAGGVANFVGRLGTGVISTRKRFPAEVWFCVINLLSAVVFWLNAVAHSFEVLMTLSAVYGLVMGAKVTSQTLLVMNAVGPELYKVGYTMYLVCIGISFPLTGALIGGLYDRTQSYVVSFCAVGTCDVIVAIITIAPVCWRRCRRTSRRVEADIAKDTINDDEQPKNV